ncbi:MAG: hypothetical protein AB7E49_09955, partial [Campylobacterales bacterium]
MGAGFSYAAGMPSQKALMNDILKLDFGALEERAIEYYEIIRKLRNFLSIFGNENVKDIDVIEDLFTILDRSYNNEEYFCDFDWIEMHSLRDGLIDLIIALFDKKQNSIGLSKAYLQFADMLKKSRLSTSKSVSIISLNWDTILEKSLSSIDNIAIDYCFYTYGLAEEHIPHITLKARGFNNLKILKPHGSINWLVCSNCGRMFVDTSKNISKIKTSCRFCINTMRGIKVPSHPYVLKPFLVTPTLLKEFDNLHLKYIWQNSLV